MQYILSLLMMSGCNSSSDDEGGTILNQPLEGSGWTETGQPGDDTATDPTLLDWTGLYPDQTYDCSAGVPEPPFVRRTIQDVVTAEDFVFDTQGFLVGSGNNDIIVKYSYDGLATPFSPAIAARPFDILPDGDLVVIDNVGLVTKIDQFTGSPQPMVSINFGPGGVDVDKDGKIYVSSLFSSRPAIIDSNDWSVSPLSATSPTSQAYGLGLSADEQTVFIGEYATTSQIFAWNRQGDTWSEPTLFAELPSPSTAGMTSDICGNLYVIQPFSCRLFRIDPQGEVTFLDEIQTPGANCPSLEFGSGLGGWSATSLFVSTYDEVMEYEVGVPGRER